ncbi:MAG: 4-hydroxy-tetrahydrodipicolinate synthase [bacterium]|nr:4-hydroxy-tetrahydrodipicolinate synthase [bacterium]
MFKGSIVALITPFNGNGEINFEELSNLVDFHIENKTDAILCCGTTGESASLTMKEHLEVIKNTVEFARNKIPVIAGTGSSSTKETLELTRYAKEVGASAALIVCPYYSRPTQRGLIEHFEYIAKEVDIPIIIYNIPSRTGVNFLPDSIKELVSRNKRIIGVKEASGNLDQVAQLIAETQIEVYSGDDSLTLAMMVLGAKGVISVAANLFPKQMVELTHAALEGNFVKAKEIHYKLLPLFKALFIESNPIPVKAAAKYMGLIKTDMMRLPLTKMDEKNFEKLKKIIDSLKS